MGGNIQKVDGRWRIGYRNPQANRHCETFDARREADDALDGIKARIKKGEFVAAKLITKFQVAEDWLASKADRLPARLETRGLRSACISIRSWAIPSVCSA